MDAIDNLMLEWDCVEVLPVLKENKVTIDRLKYLSPDDIKEMIPLVGLRAEFREKLLLWKNQKSPMDDNNFTTNFSANASTTSKVSIWMEKNISSSPINSFSIDVVALLSGSRKGNAIQKFYKDNNFLMDVQRNEIISIILDAAMEKDIKLHAKDFLQISRQIITAFPTESEDYYYIPRAKRKNSKNPGGKMYDKFYNLAHKRKRQRLSNSVPLNTHTQDIKQEECLEFEDEGVLKMKLALQNDINAAWCHGTDPPTVNELWKNTYFLRRKDLTESYGSNFLIEWPAYKQTFGHKLFHYDFSVLHPGKENAIFEKWNAFKQLMFGYYEENIKNKNSREEFAVCKQISNRESVNYIIARLLNSIMIPTARFHTNAGDKATRKYTISDSDVCFAVHLTHMHECHLHLNEIREKYYALASPLQPIMIVVGVDIYQLSEFYVYFDGFLYKFETFVECLVTCFQIFKVLDLTYPKACQNAWIFVQKYFFSIDDNYEFVPSVSSVLNYLQRDNLN